MVEPTIAVLIPTRGTLYTKGVSAMIRELTPYNWSMLTTVDLPIPDCRNFLLENAMDAPVEFTHFLMLDDDVILPDGGLKKMIDMDKPIVIIDYPTHGNGPNEKNMGTASYTDKTNKEVLWGGLGCTLVKREVIEKLERPYFRCGGQFYEKQGDKDKKILYGKREGVVGGEDYEFFKDCRKLGYNIDIVRDEVAGHARIMRHIGVIEYDKYVKQHDIVIADKIEKQWK